LVLDTAGSTYATVLAVYTYAPPLLGYESLIPVACDVGTGGGGASRVEFLADPNRVYLVVIDGVNGARGQARLNYVLTPVVVVPRPPVFVWEPESLVVAAGNTVALSAGVAGATPITCQWERDGVPLAGETGPSLTLVSVEARHAGRYALQVANPDGTATSQTATIEVRKKASIELNRATDQLVLGFPAVQGFVYGLEESGEAGASTWGTKRSVLTDRGGMVWVWMPRALPHRGFYRLGEP
jgi:hypothetical protein